MILLDGGRHRTRVREFIRLACAPPLFCDGIHNIDKVAVRALATVFGHYSLVSLLGNGEHTFATTFTANLVPNHLRTPVAVATPWVAVETVPSAIEIIHVTGHGNLPPESHWPDGHDQSIAADRLRRRVSERGKSIRG